MSKQDKIAAFNSSGVGLVNNNIFGLPFEIDEVDTVVIPVPWEVTVSYSAGTAQGPEAVIDASYQLDLFDIRVKDAWKAGIAALEIPVAWLEKSNSLRTKTSEYIKALEAGEYINTNGILPETIKSVNQACFELKEWVKARSREILDRNQLPVVLGGEHSTPLGLIEALAEKYPDFAIIQIDAHADLRVAYEGFEYSHASIMHNALKLSNISKLVQVGIRDICDAEVEMINSSGGRISTWYDWQLKEARFEGATWSSICDSIIKDLPEHVYISFDIDGLSPYLCPNTGTPVPGGLEFDEAIYLINELVNSGKKIIGCDLCEVAPGDSEWDANVGARVLYAMCNLMSKSHRDK